MRLAQKWAINEKSIIFIQSLWNFVKMTMSWIVKIAKFWAWLDKNYGFFINSIFQSQSHFLLLTLYFNPPKKTHQRKWRQNFLPPKKDSLKKRANKEKFGSRLVVATSGLTSKGRKIKNLVPAFKPKMVYYIISVFIFFGQDRRSSSKAIWF